MQRAYQRNRYWDSSSLARGLVESVLLATLVVAVWTCWIRLRELGFRF